jgi:hypothetical protein
MLRNTVKSLPPQMVAILGRHQSGNDTLSPDAFRGLARQTWHEYDMRYVIQRILRAIKESKGTAILLLCLIPTAVHAKTNCKGSEIIQPEVVRCIGHSLHAAPCKQDDVGYVDQFSIIHLTKQLSWTEICAVIRQVSRS